MGYSTDFDGQFTLNRKLDDETYNFLLKLSRTRRMKRDFPAGMYGVEGEFYVDGSGDFGQGRELNVVDYNKPPSTQPSLWCQWKPTEDRLNIVWDGSEKFYEYVEWIQYIVDKILAPRGYILNGEVKWQGEDHSDIGRIVVVNNTVKTQTATIVYG